MKKIIMAFSVACVALSFASCDKATQTTATADKGFTDSISTVSAQINGAMFAKNVENLPEADRAKFNKEEFLSAFKEVYLSDTTKLSYILGLQVGLNVLQQQRQMDLQGVPTDRNIFFKNFAEAFKLDSVPADQMKQWQDTFQKLQGKAYEIMTAKQREDQAKKIAQQEEENKANMEAGKKYVDDLKAKDKAIQTTESGLSYKIEKAGEGAKVKEDDRVAVKYTGKLIDGTEFDSNDSIVFSPRGVVPGFGEGLKLLSKGSKATLYIPGNLGYGQNGAGDRIAPGATLVFDIEILDINPGK